MINTLQHIWERRRSRFMVRPKVHASRLMLFATLFGLLLGAVLAIPLSQAALIAKGIPSPTTVEAPHALIYVSEIQTRAAQQKAANDPQNIVYRTERAVLGEQRIALMNTLDAISAVRNDPSLSQTKRVTALTQLGSFSLGEAQAQKIVQLTNDQWQLVADQTRTMYDEIIRQHNNILTEADIAQLRSRDLPNDVSSLNMPSQQKDLVAAFVSGFLHANSVIDQAATERNKAASTAAVEPIKRTIARGQNIVRRGDIVTDEIFESLTQLGVVRGAGGFITTIQQFGLGVLIAVLWALYLSMCQDGILRNGRALSVIAGVICLVVFVARLLIPTWQTVPFVFPFAAVGVLLAVIFNSELALIASFMFAPLIGLQHPFSLQLSLVLALGSAAGVFTTRHAHRTTMFAWTAAAVGATTIFAGLVFWLNYPSDIQWVEGRPMINAVLVITVFSIINGILSAVLTLGASHFLSRAANAVTPLQLMELSHPNQPLLRRMMREAPGTYHHSMVVSNLAEMAAESIGADPLLTRVGAYYHDVGKLLRPYFYTDNQHDRSNVHDQLDAKTSASVIIDHVREGTKLAQQYHLPQQIVDFIPQHHGTNVVSYFYKRALQEDAEADLQSFSYPGPKPQTREAAILMLADGVEAAVRAKSQAGKLLGADQNGDDSVPTTNTIDTTVEQIVNERIGSHQLDESPLTLRDISTIKASFSRTLQGIYHPRVDYAKHQRVR
ncbi:MAG: HDIG domain-containing protein [Herpetosiphon sp.]